ncbi:MAG: AzlC family ABC transporter permease [Desulfovermiculus sp.]|nr:AzlC family ABC transporter permease [Desulfovermiculus sp.]
MTSQHTRVTSAAPSRPHWLLRALQQTLPIILGYLPVGFAYGVLAQKSGLSAANTMLMSLIVFAGSAQLIAVGLLAAGTGAASVILTTFVVNLRHLLMSAALAPYLRSWTRWQQAVFAFQLTDETFALHSSRFPRGETAKPETLAINMIAQAAWLGGSFFGLWAGTLITDVKPIGLDYALPAMFMVLLVWQLTSLIRWITAVLAGLISVGLALAGLSQANVILAAVLAASLGLGVDIWTNSKS